MPRIVNMSFGAEFDRRRAPLLIRAKTLVEADRAAFEHAGAVLDERFSEREVADEFKRRSRDARRRRMAQPHSSSTPIRGPQRKGDATIRLVRSEHLLVERLTKAVAKLSAENQPGRLLQLLGHNLPASKRDENAMLAILVGSLVVDPDAGKYLAGLTDLAACKWIQEGAELDAPQGRVLACQLWGYEALGLLQEGLDVLRPEVVKAEPVVSNPTPFMNRVEPIAAAASFEETPIPLAEVELNVLRFLEKQRGSRRTNSYIGDNIEPAADKDVIGKAVRRLRELGLIIREGNCGSAITDAGIHRLAKSSEKHRG